MSSAHPPTPHHPHHHEPSLSSVPAPSAAAASATDIPAAATAPINPLPAASIPHVRLMCSYGGRILPRPGDHLLRYVGGETRMVSLPKSASFSTLLSLLSSLSPSQFSPKSPPVIKYQLPHEDLDSLISLSSDDDLINMLEELDRLNPSSKSPRLRLFLFPSSNSGAFGSVLSTGESNQWFLDALNSATPLERRRSEASSSMLSDQPDYLTGIDTGSDSPSMNDRSPVTNQDADRAEPTEPAEPAQAAQPQEIQTQPAGPAQPIYYMPQPVPVYYVPAPVPYMQPSMDGRRFMPVPFDQLIRQVGPTSTAPPAGGYHSDPQLPAGGYLSDPQLPAGGYLSDPLLPAGGYLSDPQLPAGGYLYEPQLPAGGFVRAPLSYPVNAVYSPHQQQVLSDPGLKPPAVSGSDLKGGRNC